MFKINQKFLQNQKDLLQKSLQNQKQRFKKFIKPKPEEQIGIFNLLLFGSIAIIIVISAGQLLSQEIIKAGLKNNLPEFQITTDLFVDGNSVIEKRDGSPLKPFKSISQALTFIEKNPEVKNIYIFPAQYQGSLNIPQNINLHASYPKTSIITTPSNKKNLILNGNNLVQGLTIKGGRYVIYIPSEAQSIQIKNCQISDADWYGVYNEEHLTANEQYKLEITNSKISSNSLQGLYLQKGTFIMANSRSINNGEEGIDLHIGMNSTISNCIISDNGEGGIETELGEVNLTVENCLIENNGSSGINLQTHSENSIVKIENNSINNNTNFGIRCALHAKVSNPYFPKALQPFPTKFNTFSNNGKTAIDPNCQQY